MSRSKILGFVPSMITLANLFCGCLGVVWVFEQQLHWAVYMIWTSAFLDTLDGLAARALRVSSELGKQLDSLADLVSFGLLPAAIIYMISSNYISAPWPYAAFIITVSSAVRLAKFNLDPNQSINFTGLPTPANAILISSLPLILHQNPDFLRPELENPIIWLLIVGILSYLLISKLPLLGFKFKNYRWSDNKYRFVVIGLGLILALSLGILAIPWILLTYIATSIIWHYTGR